MNKMLAALIAAISAALVMAPRANADNTAYPNDVRQNGINGPTGMLIGAGLTVCGWNDVFIPAVETNQTIPAQIPTNFPEGIHEKYGLDLAHAQTLVTFALADLCTWPVN